MASVRTGYENFDFEVPVGDGTSDCYTRVMLKVEELRQSLRILKQFAAARSRPITR